MVQGDESLSWNLVVFVGAALVLGQALIDTGAAGWIVDRLFELSGVREASSALVILVLVAVVSLTSHIYMTSHAARAAALVPPLLYLGVTLDLSLPAVMFLGTVGMDYCLTFPVSSKALLLFAELDSDSFEPPDLLKLSSVLLLAHLALMVLFYFGYWQFVGLAL
ncbi:MAG: anion permease [Geodermatophilaceae bacterium]